MKRPRSITYAVATAVALLGIGPMALRADTTLTDRLPNLAMVAPFAFRLEVPSTGKRLLRFSTAIVNIGVGPFQLFGFDPDGVTSAEDVLQVRQQILQSDETFRIRNTTATMKWAADGHNHFHIIDLQRIELQNLKAQTMLRTAKTGFCFLDSWVYGSTKPSQYDQAHFVCNVASNRTVPMGISVRWGDIYRSTIAFQWIDITGLPAGDYRISLFADPPSQNTGRFLESNEANNQAWATIRLTSKTVTVLSQSPMP